MNSIERNYFNISATKFVYVALFYQDHWIPSTGEMKRNKTAHIHNHTCYVTRTSAETEWQRKTERAKRGSELYRYKAWFEPFHFENDKIFIRQLYNNNLVRPFKSFLFWCIYYLKFVNFSLAFDTLSVFIFGLVRAFTTIKCHSH